jgi:hypothetical protein
MESKQQTAVRKLINYITERGFDLEYEMEMSFLDLEEEQIMKAFSDGQQTPMNHPTLPHYSREEYYNEQYGK